MVSKLILPGDKVEMRKTFGNDSGAQLPQRDYVTKVYDIINENIIEVYVPIEKAKLILINPGEEYLLTFHGIRGLYQCFGRILDRYKDAHFYILKLELLGELAKCQRRDYYRFNCSLTLHYRGLEKEEILAIVNRRAFSLEAEIPLMKATIDDISAGGLRFHSTQRHEPGSVLYCCFQLPVNGGRKTFEVLVKVLFVKASEEFKGNYEHRIKYINMREEEREEIIRYIFDEERKNRKTSRKR